MIDDRGDRGAKTRAEELLFSGRVGVGWCWSRENKQDKKIQMQCNARQGERELGEVMQEDGS